MKKIIILVISIILISSVWFFYGSREVGQEVELEKDELFVFINMDETLDQDIIDNFKRQFYAGVELIKNNQDGSSGWIVAGNMKKSVNDFSGAERLYLEGLKKYPTSFVLEHNLADLYYHFIEDYGKAEEYFLKVIESKSKLADSYTELSIIYRVKFKDKEKSINILRTGLENNPENKELMVFLANLYKKFDMVSESKEIWNELVRLSPNNELYKKELNNLDK